MQVDYIIVGQGLCGTFLSWNLMKAGKRVLVIDDAQPSTSTKVASGVINPVTGRRIVRTWEIEKLLPFAWNTYSEFGDELGLELVRKCNILNFHPTPQMELAFRDRMPDETEYLKLPEDQESWRTYFNFPFSIGEIDPCLLIELHGMLSGWRKKLEATNSLLSDRFEWSACQIETDRITYQDYTAQKIIFCEGAEGIDNRFFNSLPYSRNKGEAIIANIPDLPRNHIYKQGISIVPWHDGLWWIGSTHEWNFTDLMPSVEFRRNTQTQLFHWLKLPFEIIDHIASERPTNMERRPFAGLHPIHASVGLFNGMGTKGCSLAPYFAKQFADYLIYQTPMEPLVDIDRFKKILSR
jgi:glycine/D-amino acid oxidase-like deaminating enzyme